MSSPAAPNAAEIARARRLLALADPALARAHAATPAFGWRSRSAGFAALARLIVEQQVSVASAAAIWGRLESALGEASPQAVLACGEAGLRRLGLSTPKARYVIALAEAAAAGTVDFAALAALDDTAAAARLRALKGVGRWTADTYLLFCEARPDVLPAGDVALQEGLRLAAGLALRPTEAQLQDRAERWRPHRGVAAHLLWRFYGGIRRGEIHISA